MLIFIFLLADTATRVGDWVYLMGGILPYHCSRHEKGFLKRFNLKTEQFEDLLANAEYENLLAFPTKLHGHT